MGVVTRIEVVDPSNPEKPILRMTVPGPVAPSAIRKGLQVGITIKVDVGGKTRRRTATVKVSDEELRRAIEAYVDSLEVRLVEVSSEERVVGGLRLSDIASE